MIISRLFIKSSQRTVTFRITLFIRSLAVGIMMLPAPASAQWVDQTIELRPGWNAVFLEVQPDPTASSEVFKALPVESVWRWNRKFRPIQFIDDPGALVPPQQDWLVYLPATHPLARVSNLFAIEGGRPYLVKIPENTAPVTWTVRGKPVLRTPQWISDSLNFAGCLLPSGNTPTFQAYFSGSPAHKSGPVYRLDAAGHWQIAPMNSPMKRGEAFWIRTQGASSFGGPLEIVLEQADRLDFGTALVEQTLRIRNSGSSPLSLVINVLSSAEAPEGSAANVGNVPLALWRAETSSQLYEWVPIEGDKQLGLLHPGEQSLVRLAIRREALAPAIPAGTTRGQFQSLLQISEADKRYVRLVPVTADYSPRPRLGLQSNGANDFANLEPGLWIGNAVILKVSQPGATVDSDKPKPTASELNFRLILHVDASGQSRLLQQAMLMFKSGRVDANGNVIEPGEQVLVTDDALIPRFSGAALRDGQQAGRRFSTVAFGFSKPVAMTGRFGGYRQPLVCRITMDYDDPLNPFKHRYHPDHNNLSDNYRSTLPEGRESFTFHREVGLIFSRTDPFNLNLPDYGTRHIGGVYQERIEGIHRRPIFIEGAFRLHHASSVSVLNGGL